MTFVRGCVAGQSQSRAGGHRSSAVKGVVLRMRTGSGVAIENSVPSGVGHSLAVHAHGTHAPVDARVEAGSGETLRTRSRTSVGETTCQSALPEGYRYGDRSVRDWTEGRHFVVIVMHSGACKSGTSARTMALKV